MKTLRIIGAVALLAVAVPATAQIHMSQPLFNTSEAIAAAAATSAGITNAYPGISFTNLAGVAMITTNNVVTNSGMANIQLLTDVNLWALRDGSTPYVGWTPASSTNTLFTEVMRGYANISATIVGAGAGLNAAVTFRIVPLADGVNESTTAADSFVFSVTGNGTTPVTVVTNIPMHRWQGVKKLRLKSIENGDADTVAWVRSVTLNGFVP